jgi:2-dehydro-3-deoxy-L-rhamnonate dehydrogenase (NAD+)
MNWIDLEGRVAIVTGAAAGIGNAIAQRCAASGAAVALWDVNEAAAKAAASALGMGHLGIGLGVADETAVERASEATAAHFGKVDILVCSAGITGPTTTTWD